MSYVLKTAQNSKIGDHFKFAIARSWIEHFIRKHKVWNVKKYIHGCMMFEKHKKSNAKKLKSPEILEMPEQR